MEILGAHELHRLYLAKIQAELVAVAEEVRVCADCGRGPSVPGHGGPGAAVILLGGAVGADEVAAGKVFAGPTQQALDAAWQRLGLGQELFYATAAVKCSAAPGENPAGDSVKRCVRHLALEIAALEPAVIVAFGPSASASLRLLGAGSAPDDGEAGRPRGSRLSLLTRVITAPALPEALSDERRKRELWEALKLVPGALGPA